MVMTVDGNENINGNDENDGNDADGDGNYGYNDDGNDDDGNDDNDDDSIYKGSSVGGLGWWSGRASSSSCPPKVSEVKGKFEY